VEVPARDGVILRVDVYRPEGDGRFPVLMSAQPYGKGALPARRRLPATAAVPADAADRAFRPLGVDRMGGAGSGGLGGTRLRRRLRRPARLLPSSSSTCRPVVRTPGPVATQVNERLGSSAVTTYSVGGIRGCFTRTRDPTASGPSSRHRTEVTVGAHSGHSSTARSTSQTCSTGASTSVLLAPPGHPAPHRYWR
jgi:hypothetical protein